MLDRILFVRSPRIAFLGVRGREATGCAQAVLGEGRGHPEVTATLR